MYVSFRMLWQYCVLTLRRVVFDLRCFSAVILFQREAEYAEARQRILGSSGIIEKTQGPER